MISRDVIRNVVHTYFQSINDLDITKWLSTFSDNAQSFDPVGAPVTEGKEALSGFFKGLVSVFEQVTIRTDHIYISGNGVAVKFSGEGTAKNKKTVSFDGIDVFEINNDGKIQKMWGYWDPAGMVAKIQGST